MPVGRDLPGREPLQPEPWWSCLTSEEPGVSWKVYTDLVVEKARLEAELRIAQEKAVAEHRFKGIEDARYLAKQAQDAHDLHSNGLIQMLKEQASSFPTRAELNSLKEQLTDLRLVSAKAAPLIETGWKLLTGAALAYAGIKLAGL